MGTTMLQTMIHRGNTMHKIHWNRLGHVIVTAVLIVTAGAQSNWLAFVALVHVMYLLHVVYHTENKVAELFDVLDDATDVISMLLKREDDGDIKN